MTTTRADGLRVFPTLLLGLAWIAAAPPTARSQATYVGSEACRECHEAEWSSFRTTAHGFTLRADAAPRPLPLPADSRWEDVRYVLGGNRRVALYVDQNGYFITEADGKPGANQYDLATGEWVDFHAGETKAFDCAECHTTGYSPTGSQDGLPGIVGTWALDGVQCEACHGPGSLHLAPPHGNILADPDSARCGECHSNGPLSKVPAADGFIQTNSEYNELLASPHDDRWCVECHDPHRPAELSIYRHCTQCHAHLAMSDEEFSFKKLGRQHLDRGIECWDCHMPYLVKIATSEGKWRGDARSHLFEITLDEDAVMFHSNGTLARDKITAGFACLGCHQDIVDKFQAAGDPDGAEAWARKYAKKIHKN